MGSLTTASLLRLLDDSLSFGFSVIARNLKSGTSSQTGAKDRPQGPDETYADHLGISVLSSEPLALENAIRWPKHVAAVLLPEAEGFSIARTYPEIEGHYSVWGDPERLLANVQRVSTHSEPGKFQSR
jgi:hypothetical protein